MCTRYLLRRPAELAAKLGLRSAPAVRPRFNAAPRQRLPIVRRERAETGREAVLARWGFAGEAAGRAPLINARAETAASKTTFQDSFRRRRCVVPADGFYEWERTGGTPLPWLFEPAEPDELLLLGGLWRESGDDGAPAEAETVFVVLTTAPNALVAPLHDRMPVLVPATALDDWLDPATPPGRLAELLAPRPATSLRAKPVHPRLNKVTCDDRSCLEPPPAAALARQLDLGLG